MGRAGLLPVKVTAVPLLSTAHDEPSAFETLARQAPAAED